MLLATNAAFPWLRRVDHLAGVAESEKPLHLCLRSFTVHGFVATIVFSRANSLTIPVDASYVFFRLPPPSCLSSFNSPGSVAALFYIIVRVL